VRNFSFNPHFSLSVQVITPSWTLLVSGRAYDILSDEKKRETFDRYGEAAVDAGAASSGGRAGGAFGTGGNPFGGFQPNGGGEYFDLSGLFGGRNAGMGGGASMQFDLGSLFGDMLGGGNMRHRGGQQQRPVSAQLQCSLDEIYTGCTKRLKVRHPSSQWRGSTRPEHVYEITVKPGWKDGTKVKFKQIGDMPPVTFCLACRPHKYYQRICDDLIWVCTLNEKQALSGVKITVPLPGGGASSGGRATAIVLNTRDGAITFNDNGRIEDVTGVDMGSLPTKTRDRIVVAGRGMPKKGGTSRGDLIIEFRVVNVSVPSS